MAIIKSPKDIFAELRVQIDPLLKEGFTINDIRSGKSTDKPLLYVHVVLTRQLKDLPPESKLVGLQFSDTEAIAAEAVFNMLTDYAQSISTNAR